MRISEDKKTHLMYRPETFDLNVIREQVSYKPIMKSPTNVLDIGGNIGAFANFALSQGANIVYSIEPEPQNFQLLAINCDPEKGHYILNKAVVANDVFGPMQLSINVGINKGLHSLIKRRGRLTVEVETVQLNELFRFAEFDTVKIDIEGYEYTLLNGFVFPPSVKNLAIEYHFDRKVYEQRKAIILSDALAEQGFFSINGGSLDKRNFATLKLYRR